MQLDHSPTSKNKLQEEVRHYVFGSPLLFVLFSAL
jgi:hypothetical protein